MVTTSTGLGALARWRLAVRIMRLDLRAQLEYRTEFCLTVLVGAVWQTSVIVFATVLLTQFSGIGGWSSDQVLLIAGIQMFAHSVFVLFFGRIAHLPKLAQQGMLDVFLLRPLPVYRQVLLTGFPVNAIGDLSVAAALFGGGVVRSHIDWSPASAGYLAAAVAGGALTEAAVVTALSSAALHYPAASQWTAWLQELIGTFGIYPLNILPRTVRYLFTYLLPLAFVAYLPATALLDRRPAPGIPAWLVTVSPLAGLALYAASRRLWKLSLNRYTGVNG
ncbi:ABC transporter permease [Kitasatospora purpeofusca]|uniref:ABC transporter permease n=1 Tax=Kitasatospora purpeofusca TaxID=67352 RepID=UPI003F4AF7B7